MIRTLWLTMSLALAALGWTAPVAAASVDASGAETAAAAAKAAKSKVNKPKASTGGKSSKDRQRRDKDEPAAEPASKESTGPPAAPKEEAAAKTEDAKPAAAAKSGSTPDPPAAETHTVKRELIKVEVSLEGVFEAKTAHEVSIDPETWTTYEVAKAVEHGQTVKKGDVLIEFDTKEIDEAIADQETTVRLGKLNLKQSEESLRLQEQQNPLDLAAAARGERIASEDLKRFLETDRDLAVRSAKNSLAMAQDSYDYQKEELEQLEKMYEADDLTEETEEIVLKRQRDAVKRAEFYLEWAKIRAHQEIDVDIPRIEEMLRASSKMATLADERASTTLPGSLSRARVDLEKAKVQQARDEEKLAKLKVDLAGMAVRSPADGVVYYGHCDRGKWSSAAMTADDLRPGSNASTSEVLMTVVSMRPLVVRATVPERQLHRLREGLKASVEPAGYPDWRLAARVASIESIPYGSATFGAMFSLTVNHGEQAALVPGMACTVKLVPYLNREALVVPVAAVETDKLDDRKHYVYLPGKSGKPTRRAVTTGEKVQDRYEILDGVREGEKVLKEVPKSS